MKRRRKKKKNLGFTLIELVVVISIITFIASILLVAFNRARVRSRDAKKIQDIQSFAKALEFFYDKYGIYPCGGFNGGTHNYDWSFTNTFLDGLEFGSCIPNTAPTTGLVTAKFLPALQPTEFLEDTYTYETPYVSNRQYYVLYVHLEDNPKLMSTDGGLCNNFYEIGSGAGRVSLNNNVTGYSCN